MVPFHIYGGHARPRATPPCNKRAYGIHVGVYGRRGWALRGMFLVLGTYGQVFFFVLGTYG